MLKRIRDLLARRGRQPAGDVLPVSPGESDVETATRPQVQHGPRVVHQPIPRSDLDPDAVKIVHRLTRFDHAAYLVGGCVRDLLLEHKPKDFDIGTSATPRQIKRLFRNCRIIGRRFRLAHIYFQNGKVIEVATFRAQDEDAPAGEVSTDSGDLLIRDDNQFGTMEEDALRRDFTINSLFYDVNAETVLDHADGLGDLRRKLVRTIGDPVIRFKEDPIRILRAIKFAARLDFEIESRTLAALGETRDEIPKAAAPRILEELNRFCRGGAARRSFELLREYDVLGVVAPEVAGRYRDDPVAWNLLLELLEGFDRQTRDGGEVTTGQILAALVLPPVMESLGWHGDGTIDPVDGLDVRAAVDDVMRPLAIRLRVSRKDQEHCRQVIATLHRMVPVGSMHRNTRRSILRRLSLPHAMVILDTLSRTHAGPYDEAATHWRKATAGRRRKSEKPPAARAQQKKGADDAAPKRRRRRRGTRGGSSTRDREESRRGKRPTGRPTAGASRPQTKGEDLPPVWDDDYFFAALPSVPEGSGGNLEGNRYESPKLDGKASESPGEPAERSGDEPSEPKPRRRSRRRRRPARPKQNGGSEGEEG
jgi:poly(A) polymerase